MQRFVILFHSLPAANVRSSHWDLMLENGDSLLTFAMQSKPQTGSTIAADRLHDHDPKYLDYEGPISNDRGEVSRIANGTWKLVSGHLDSRDFGVELHFESSISARWHLQLTETKSGLWKIRISE